MPRTKSSTEPTTGAKKRRKLGNMLTSDCIDCAHCTPCYNTKEGKTDKIITIFCAYKEKTYIYGQCIPDCEYKTLKTH